jgi:acetyl esterase/lipase
MSPPEAETYGKVALFRSGLVAGSVGFVPDLAYGPDPAQKLDLYLPKAGGTALPVLVFVHGGAWTHGYKEWMGLTYPAVRDLPAIMVSIDYRMGPDHKFPAALEDLLSAIAWVRANIARHGGDPDRLFVGGHSAGGHLTALATVRRDLHARFGLPENAIKGCFPVGGQMTFEFPERLPGSTEERIHTLFLPSSDAAKAASPLAHVAGCKTPFLIAFGEKDIPRIVKSGGEMDAALKAQGAEVATYVFKGLDHFEAALALEDAQGEWARMVRQRMAG